MSGLIQRFADIRPHSDTDRARQLLQRFEQEGPHGVRLLMAGSELTGASVLIESPGEPPCILEAVTSVGGLEAQTPSGVDFVTEPTVVSCLYKAHPLFTEPKKLIEARKEVIEVLTDFASSTVEIGPRGAVIRCPARGIPVYIKELTFMQLLDTMKFCTERYFH